MTPVSFHPVSTRPGRAPDCSTTINGAAPRNVEVDSRAADLIRTEMSELAAGREPRLPPTFGATARRRGRGRWADCAELPPSRERSLLLPDERLAHQCVRPLPAGEKEDVVSRRKPTVEELGIDVDAISWRRSSAGPGAIEVAFAGEWVLMRLGGDPGKRVLVYDQHEWECFLDGAKNGEFDDAAS